MMHFDEWWNSAAADSFRAKHEDKDGEMFRPVWDAALLSLATPKSPATEDSSAGDLEEVQFGDAMTREGRMTVLQRNTDGTPTVWCDPEIADIVRALNSGGVKTVASCSGHGEKPGGIALADGRQLLLLESLEAFTNAMSALTQAEVQAEPVAQLIGVDEYGPRLNWFTHWVDLPNKALLYTAPHADALDAETPYQRGADAQGAPL